MKTSNSRSPSNTLASESLTIYATIFAIATPIIYTICEMQNLPLFTYHPGTNKVNFGWAAAVRDEGPAMYWYGWTAMTIGVSSLLALVGVVIPKPMMRKIPLSLVWVTPLAVIPILIYALRFFWRW